MAAGLVPINRLQSGDGYRDPPRGCRTRQPLMLRPQQKLQVNSRKGLGLRTDHYRIRAHRRAAFRGITGIVMTPINGRRNFFTVVRNLFAAGGFASQARSLQAAQAARASSAEGEDYYDKLGVTKIINAAGTYTALTASTMPPSVQAAVARAAKHPVRLIELQKAAGEYLAKQLRCEAAMVTAGAASALTLGTAACMTLANKVAIHNIPTDLTGLKNEVIVQKEHRYDYDHALRNC